MYKNVDWMKCKGCGNTDCLFKVRVDWYVKKNTGNITYKYTPWCKLCFLENCLVKNDKYWVNHKDIILNKQKMFRIINKEKYNERAKIYYQKRRLKALEYKRNKYIPVLKDGRKRKRIRPPCPMNHPIRKFNFGGLKK